MCHRRAHYIFRPIFSRSIANQRLFVAKLWRNDVAEDAMQKTVVVVTSLAIAAYCAAAGPPAVAATMDTIALVEDEVTGVTTATLTGFSGTVTTTPFEGVEADAIIPGVPVLSDPTQAIFSSVGLYDSLTSLAQSDYATLQITPFGSSSLLKLTFESGGPP
jgi:hypothetical protein